MSREHGTHVRYVIDRCRCRQCRAVALAYETRRRKQRAYGQWKPYVDAGQARAHVKRLMASGMGPVSIAAAAGVPTGSITALVYGKWLSKGTARHVARIRQSTHDRILAVSVGDARHLPDRGRTDAVGTQRRIQALIYMGWSISNISADCNITARSLGLILTRSHVRAATARAIGKTYDRLWNRPPPASTRWQRASVAQARARARAHGWVGPLAWDDDTIDSPDTRPDDGISTPRDRTGDIVDLVEKGETLPLICARLSVDPASVYRQLARTGQTDLWQQLQRGAA